MKAIGDFFLTAWLWNITFAWYYPIMASIIMFLLLKMVMRCKAWRACAIAIGAQMASYGILSLIVVGGLIHIFRWEYAPVSFQQAMGIKNELVSTISLGMIYAGIQTVLLGVWRAFYPYNHIAYLIIVWIGNALSITMTYMLIKLIMFSYYV